MVIIKVKVVASAKKLLAFHIPPIQKCKKNQVAHLKLRKQSLAHNKRLLLNGTLGQRLCKAELHVPCS